MKKIILKTDRAPAIINCNTVKLSPEAVLVLQRLQLRSGLSARQIVSDILCQAEQMVQVIETQGGEAGDE